MNARDRAPEEGGFALVAAVAIVVIGGVVLSLLWNLGARESAAVVGELESAQALYIAQAGVEMALTAPDAYRESFAFAGGTVTLESRHDRVTATAEYRGRVRRVSVALKSSVHAARR